MASPIYRPLVLLLASTLACASRDSGRVPLTVLAASSLSEVFREVEDTFEAMSPRVDVQLVLSGSQVLRLQIEQGVRADVFASANESHMDALVEGAHVEKSWVIARNELVIIVPRANPAGIERFEQLANARRLVLGTAHVPVGIYARQMLERAGAQLGEGFVQAVKQSVVSEESNVRLVRTKVALGEADAAIVYRTDALSSDAVRAVPIPERFNVRAKYPIGVLKRALHPAEAGELVSFLRSPRGQTLLARHGFVQEVP